MNHNKIRLKNYQLIGIKITLGVKRRERPIPEFEQLAQAKEQFKKAIMESYFGKIIIWILNRLEKFLEKLGRIKIF